MRNFSKLLLFSIIGFFLSCNNAGIIPTEPVQSTQESIYDLEFYAPEFIYTGVDELIQVKQDSLSEKVGSRIPFSSVLGRLNLDSLQRMKAIELLVKHKECTKSCITTLKQKQAEILSNSRIEFNKIKFDIDAGNITKVQGRELIKALNTKTKAEIQELAKSLKVRECLDQCDSTFINSLKRILNERQVVILNDILTKKTKKTDTVRVKRDSIEIKKDTIRIKRDSIDIKKDSIGTTGRGKKRG